jgi:hypothetical protein
MTARAEPRDGRHPPADLRFALAVTLVYALVLAVALSRHEMWRDELQAWMIARDSRTLPEVLDRARYEGSPGLWHLLLFGLSRFTPEPAGMQGLHLVLASAGVFVFCAFAPFRRWERGLLSFGYFSLFEYGVVSRAYVLGPVLLWSACALLPWRRTRLPALLGVLTLMALGSITAAIVAASLAAVLLWGYAAGERADRAAEPWTVRRLAAPLLAAAAGAALVYWCARQPTDVGLAQTRWWLRLDPAQLYAVVKQPWSAYVPIPPPVLNFWGVNILWKWHGAVVLLSIGLVVGFGLWLRSARLARTFFWLATGLLLAFAYLRWVGALRHWGFLYLTLLAACWIARVESAEREAPVPHAKLVKGRSPLALAVVMAAQAIAAAMALTSDFLRPFSLGSAVAAHVRTRGLAGLPIYGQGVVGTIGGYLGVPIYRFHDVEPSTFVKHNLARVGVPPDLALARLRTLLQERGGAGVMVLSEPAEPWLRRRPIADLTPANGFQVEPLGRFQGSIVRTEDCRLYLLRLLPAGQSPGTASGGSAAR